MTNVVNFEDGTLVCGEFPLAAPVGPFKLIIADPPYGGILKQSWDKQTADGYIALAEECYIRLVNGGSVYIWGGIGKPQQPRVFFEFLSRVEKETGLVLQNVITWKKKRAYGKQDDYLFTREECAWLTRGVKPSTFHVPYLDQERGYAGYNKKYPAKSKYLRRTNVWTDITEMFRGKWHEAQKPSRLAEVMIETHTEPGDTVFDPFAGSGSTALAARKLERRWFLVEKDLAAVNKIEVHLSIMTEFGPKKKRSAEEYDLFNLSTGTSS
jgi:DNA modification methylase